MHEHQLESLLVKLLRSRGYTIRSPSWSADHICYFDTHKRIAVNLTELAKDIGRELDVMKETKAWPVSQKHTRRE